MHHKEQENNSSENNSSENIAIATYKIANMVQSHRSGIGLSDEDKLYVSRVATLRTGDEHKTLLHLAATDKNIESQIFINAMNVLNKVISKGIMLNVRDDNDYSILCSILSAGFKGDDDKSQNSKKSRIDSALFLISQGSSCTYVMKFKELHKNLSIALQYRNAFFHALATTLFENYTRGEEFKTILAKFETAASNLYRIYSGKETSNVLEDIAQIKVDHESKINHTSYIISSVGILHFLCRKRYENSMQKDLLSQLMIEFIRTKSIDINAQDSCGFTALHLVAAYGNLTVANCLLSNKKLDMKVLDNMKQTPLFRSLLSLNAEVVSFFIKAGFDVNAFDSKGFSVLHRAVTRNVPEIVGMLLENGAIVETINESGQSPITTAIQGRVSNDILSMLKEYSEDLSFHTKLIPSNERYKVACCTIL